MSFSRRLKCVTDKHIKFPSNAITTNIKYFALFYYNNII